MIYLFFILCVINSRVFKNVWSKPLNSQQLPITPHPAMPFLCYVIAAKKEAVFPNNEIFMNYAFLCYIKKIISLNDDLPKMLYGVLHDQIKKCQKCSSFSAAS